MLFIRKYLSKLDYELLLSNYNINYLQILDEGRFQTIYELLLKYNLNYTRDIILRYIEIFTYPQEVIEHNLINLIQKLGNNYAKIIGNDLRYLNEIIPEKKKVKQ